MGVDLLVCNTPVHVYSSNSNKKTQIGSQPLGLLSICTYLKQHGFEVRFVDAEYEKLSLEEIAERICAISPKFVAFNAFTPNMAVLELMLKKIDGTVRIIVGGPHITAVDAKQLERYCNVDFFVRNRGEEPICAILEGKAPDLISDLIYRRNGLLIETPACCRPLSEDQFPIIDRKFLKPYQYIDRERKFHEIYCSIGCLYNCAFCSGHNRKNGNTYFRFSWARIQMEIAGLVEDEGIKLLKLHDDCAFPDKESLLYFAKEIMEGYRIQWVINCTFQVLATLSDEDFSTLFASGCYFIAIGIESASKRLLQLCNKNIQLEQVPSLINKICKSGIKVKTYFIIGLPTETKEETQRVFSFIQKLGGIVGNERYLPRVFLFKPLPQTAFWDRLIQEGYSQSNLLENYQDMDLGNAYFDRHGWGSSLSFGAYSAKELTGFLEAFYQQYFLDGYGS